jgi:hypothetical protein
VKKSFLGTASQFFYQKSHTPDSMISFALTLGLVFFVSYHAYDDFKCLPKFYFQKLFFDDLFS